MCEKNQSHINREDHTVSSLINTMPLRAQGDSFKPIEQLIDFMRGLGALLRGQRLNRVLRNGGIKDGLVAV